MESLPTVSEASNRFPETFAPLRGGRHIPPHEIDSIIDRLAALRSPHAFNPYDERCPIADRPDAPAIRRRNLQLVLSAAARTGVEEIWVALEPTYRGVRRAGLAMTDERHLHDHGLRFGVNGLRLATITPGPDEDTAGIVWDALRSSKRRVFLWNTVPMHTHRPSLPFSIRRHNAVERRASAPILNAILDLLGPTRVVAIGYEAGVAMEKAEVLHEKVRHTARGGAARYRTGLVLRTP